MTRPWADIEAGYRGSGDIAAMLRLVEQVRASPYEPVLNAWTSMHDLCIVQVPCTYPYNGPYLEFRSIDTHIEDKQWRRAVDQDHAFARLERFMEQVHWIPRRISA